MERKQEDGIRCVEKSSPEYPEKLKNYKDMPERLYVKGRLPENDRPSAAIVGARMCSPYGRIQAFHYAKALSGAGVQIISGLAWGIDSEGHKGALEGGTPTFAVLGNGTDVCYPRRNQELYQRILRKQEGFSVNTLRALSRGNTFFRPGTESSAPCPIWCCGGGERKERFPDHSSVGAGAGKGCFCPARPGKRGVKPGLPQTDL